MSAPLQPRRRLSRRRTLMALAVAGAFTATSFGLAYGQGADAGTHTAPAAAKAPAADALPTPDHTVVVIFENHDYKKIIGSKNAPYINQLAKGGGNLTESYGLATKSQPNYMQLFSGGNQGVKDNGCYDAGFSGKANLGSELIAAGKTWASYNEGLPKTGDTTCKEGDYARKHNPWFAFKNVPRDTAYTFKDFPKDFSKLPKVSFITPDLCSDMHDCSVSEGDSWLKDNLSAYAEWAKANNSLLVTTFDESVGDGPQHISTVFYGAGVKAGSTTDKEYNHYNVLRTLEDLSGLKTHAGKAAESEPITGIWETGSGTSTPTPSS
ncbi:alkaline phosphatase family protein [Streptomyces sp. NPDC058989]|uniref:alkaline phosphatase family protein n=1 Tax=Streptomyces sp. NPDC058989 TaxID=3346686 RepID=UPI0036B377A6